MINDELITIARNAYKKPRFWSRNKPDPLIAVLEAVLKYIPSNDEAPQYCQCSLENRKMIDFDYCSCGGRVESKQDNSELTSWIEEQKAENIKLHQLINSLALKIERVDKKEQSTYAPQQSLMVYLYEKEYNYREGLARFIERLDEYLEIQLTRS